MRVTSSVPRKKRKEKVLELAKGFRGRKNRCYGLAVDTVIRSLKFAYRDRIVKKREMRSLWIIRINAAVRNYSTERNIKMGYSGFMHNYNKLNIPLNRKFLSELAIHNPSAFTNICDKVSNSLAI